MTDEEKILLRGWDKHIREQTAFLSKETARIKAVSETARQYVHQYPAVWFKRLFEKNSLIFTKFLLMYAQHNQVSIDVPFVLISERTQQLWEPEMGRVPIVCMSALDWRLKVNQSFIAELSVARQRRVLDSGAALFGGEQQVAPLPATLPPLVLPGDDVLPPQPGPLSSQP